MLNYTDLNNSTFSASKNTTCIYGPYLRTVPVLTVGPVNFKNTNTVVDATAGTFGGTAGAWYYNASTGAITANLDNTQVDVSNKAYNSY
jgi:hypothetical protein